MLKILVGFVFLLSSIGMASDETIKIGYIDMQKAIQTTDAGKKAKKELETEFNSKKKDLQDKEKDLKKLSEDLEKKSMVLSDEVKQKKQLEFQEEMIKYRDLVGKSQLAIQERERNLTQPILEKLRSIIGDIGEKESYTVILEKAENSVLWAKKKIDLTDRVIAEFNKKK
ncbi:MAG: OmpH family outer membrane protein [Oligoflexia bacterium]|nr:OmpH family outer membrane protein [Oligoflexia bacterium]